MYMLLLPYPDSHADTDSKSDTSTPYEVQFDPDYSGARRFHIRCHAAWLAECNERIGSPLMDSP